MQNTVITAYIKYPQMFVTDPCHQQLGIFRQPCERGNRFRHTCVQCTHSDLQKWLV